MEIPHGTPSGYSFHKCRCDTCVDAKRAKDRAYYRKNAEKVKAKVGEYREANLDRIKAQQTEYRERNADVLSEKARLRNAANPEPNRQRVAKWKKDNPEQVKANAATYRERHRDELNAKSLEFYRQQMAVDPERVRRRRREWAKTKKGILASRAARTARRGAAYTPEALAWIASLVDPLCIYCGGFAVEIDHLTPISRGGTGDVTNLAPACRRCNSQKHTQTYDEYVQSKESQS